MINERNKSISLDEQILLIREKIRLGKQEFPIDIVDTIESDIQLYYELENGYWERYSYDSDGNLLTYLDSKNTKLFLVEPDTYKMFSDLYEKLVEKCKESNCLIITASQEQKKPIQEEDKHTHGFKTLGHTCSKVYLVETNDIINDDTTNYAACSCNLFYREANRQGHVYTVREYQDLINQDKLSMTSKYIRLV
jgi:hypothetical protein